jgi:polynucleotide kinase-phosphatase
LKIVLPEPSLVALVGPSGCGKSTFARRHFRPTEVLSSDFFRAVVSDDEANQSASKDAFELLHLAAAKRLARRRLTVVDATNVQPEGRKQLLELARRYHYPAAAVIFNLPEELCVANDERRPGRRVGANVVRLHLDLLRRALDKLGEEGFDPVYVLTSAAEVEQAAVERAPLPADRRSERGPFDVIGDVHGCIDELLTLLGRLGYALAWQPDAHGVPGVVARPSAGRKAVFVGDLGDRGPDTVAVLRLVMEMVRAGSALCVLGNHDDKLLRKLHGREVRVSQGLAETLTQLDREPPEFRAEVRRFLDGLPTHYLLDGGRLVVAHAGLREDLQGRVGGRVRAFALFGDTTGEKDEYGLPVRRDWAAEYHGHAAVIYGHTPVAEALWVNRTLNIDTGCAFGGKLTALRYPEKELVSVPAARAYAPPNRPFLPEHQPAPEGRSGVSPGGAAVNSQG